MTKTLFDHINAIYTDQSLDYFDKLDESDRKTFSVYMVNRFLSMNRHQIPVVNEFQKYWSETGPREAYLFYSQALPKGKQFNKYVKGAKEEKYEPWLVELVGRYFSVSKKDALDYLDIFYATDAGKADLRSICEMFAVEPKKIKKVKL